MNDPVASYLASLPEGRRRRLSGILSFLHKQFPAAVESLKYRMPTYETPAGFVAVGNQKHHIAIYTCSQEMIAPYLCRHPSTKHGKGYLRFGDGDNIDLQALREVFRNALS